MSLLTLRVRGPTGVSTIQLAPTASLLELRASLFAATTIAPDRQEIRTGHPPRPLDTSAGDDATLATLGLSRGDVLIVQEGEPNSQRTTVTDPLKSAAAAPSMGAVPPPASASPPQAGPPERVKPIAVSASASTAAAPTTNASTSTADSIRNSILKSQPFGSSSARSQSKHNTVTSGTSGTAGSGSARSETAATAPSAPPARNSRPQQPPLPPFSGSASSGAKPGLTSTEDANIRVDGGWMVLRVVPDDNSCMFRALGIALEGDKHGAADTLRKAVVKAIQSDPVTWCEPVLGMDPERYCERMLKPSTWGGAIELAVISKAYGIEIDSVDVQSGRADRFGEEHQYPNHILLIYSGIHYDAVTFTPLEPSASDCYPYNLDYDQTQFSRTNEAFALAGTLDLARKLKAKHYYTDTAGFALRCEVCKTALKGEKEAQAHAKQTGHASFGEF